MNYKSILIVVLIIAFTACKTNTKKEVDTIYCGGDIVTMKGDKPEYVEAVVQNEGKIVFVGNKSEALKKYHAKEVDLQGKTMFPGFIDGHCHFYGFGAQAIGANLLASPDGNVNDIDALIAELKDWAKGPDMERMGWIYGMGFDDAVLK